MDIREEAKLEELNGDAFEAIIPDISVIMHVYNFEPYLRDSFEGIIIQQTDYIMEVLVYDDCSTDGSAEIIRSYCKRYPKLFHGFIGHKNIYGSSDAKKKAEFNTAWLKRYARGRYIAFCEGDDYWTDPGKIQLQASFMDENINCMMTMHDAELVDCRNSTSRLMKQGDTEHDISVNELILQDNGIWPTASMVLRSEAFICPEWFLESGVGDWSRQLYAISKGSVHFFDKVMSVYRYMHNGSWSASIEANKKRMMHALEMMSFLSKYNRYTRYNYNDVICQRAGRFYMEFIWKIPDFDEYSSLLINEETASEDNETALKNKLVDLHRLVNDSNWLSDDIVRFVEKHEKICVMGTGKLSNILSKKLHDNNIDFEGYVISDSQEIPGDRTDVIHLSDLNTKGMCRRGILVAIGSDYYSSVIEALRCRKEEYIFPFVITEF